MFELCYMYCRVFVCVRLNLFLFYIVFVNLFMCVYCDYVSIYERVCGKICVYVCACGLMCLYVC